NSEYDVGAIAEYFCFSSPSHFAMKFKEYYGCTPGAYRKAQ
ncbi:MAG: helix-turn-helix transcriptional regulator, partial [Lachnospiraceae bacterium]|nr:helix-turn-helix transcriptional regulator [Lachnospiraceae bacterium]